MGIIDTSNIDATKPDDTDLQTQDLRDNFAAINTAFANVNTRTVANKAAAVLLTPVANALIFVNGTDGGLFKAVTGAAAATYSDNGGSYCGTQFIPTGGDGSAAWVRVDGGYNVGLRVQSRWFGTTGDDSTDDATPLQNFLNFLKGGYKGKLEAGTYKITTGLVYQTNGNSDGLDIEGAGRYSTKIKAYGTFSDDILEIDGSTLTAYTFQFGGGISGIGLEKDAAATGVTGIRANGWWYPKFFNVGFESLDGDGIICPTRDDIDSNPDGYATIGWKLYGCQFNNMDGWGIKQDNSVGSALWDIENCRIVDNELGGVQITGAKTVIHRSTMSTNGYGAAAGDGAAITVTKQKSNTPTGLTLIGNEFDGNKDAQIIIDELVFPHFRENRFITNDRRSTGNQTPDEHIRIDTSMSQGEVNQNFHRVDANLGAVNLYVCATSGVGLNVVDVNIHNFKLQNDAGATITELTNFDDKTGVDVYYNQRQLASALRRPVTMAKYLSATLTTGVNITSTPATLAFDDEVNLGTQHTEHFNTSTGQFTAPYEGVFKVRITLTFDSWAASNRLRLRPLVNSVAVEEFYWISGATAVRDTVIYETIVQATKGQTIEIESAVTGTTETLSNSTQRNSLQFEAL